MPLHLPDFRQEYLSGLTACCWLHGKREHPGLLDLDFRSTRVCSEYKAGEVDAVISLCVDSQDGTHFHVHIEINRKDPEKSFPSYFTPLPVDSLKLLIEDFLGEDAEVYWDGKFAVPRKHLPKHGMLEALLGVTTESCGTDLELQGSKFAIRGEVFTDMEWSWDEETDCIDATISAETTGEVTEDYLVKAADILQGGMNCFVLESAEDQSYATDKQRENPKRSQG